MIEVRLPALRAVLGRIPGDRQCVVALGVLAEIAGGAGRAHVEGDGTVGGAGRPAGDAERCRTRDWCSAMVPSSLKLMVMAVVLTVPTCTPLLTGLPKLIDPLVVGDLGPGHRHVCSRAERIEEFERVGEGVGVVRVGRQVGD